MEAFRSYNEMGVGNGIYFEHPQGALLREWRLLNNYRLVSIHLWTGRINSFSDFQSSQHRIMIGL